MKRVSFTFITLLSTIVCYSQRVHTERSYEVIGLPDGDEVGDSLKIAIPLLAIGLLIAFFYFSGRNESEKKDESSFNFGCVGIILIGIGVIFLLPLLAWVEYIFVNIMNIGIFIAVVVFIIFLIYSFFSRD